VELYPFDDAYVARLCAGDRFTVEHFHRYFSEMMLFKLRRQLRTFQEIDDVRQEVFVRVLQTICSAKGLRDGRRLGSFVNSVCNNVVLETYRKNRRTDALGEEHEEVPDESESIEELLLTGETKARVHRTLERLTQKERDVLHAVFFEGRDKDEVCRSFGVDRNYLRVLVHRAKEKFRNEYGPRDVDPFPPGGVTDSGKSSLRPRETEDGPHRSR